MDKRLNIAIFHFQVGHTDGVSLEIDKVKRVLEEWGHRVHLCAGHLGSTQGTLIREMYHHIPEIERLNRNTFVRLEDYDQAGYAAEFERWTDILVKRLRSFLQEHQIDLIIALNVWCVGANLPLAIALERVRRELDLPALSHNHDFYWERISGVALTCSAAIELADKYLPPRGDRIQHVVINSLAQRELAERKGITSTVVPNTFDFNAPPWRVDEYNRDLRSRIGLRDNDLFILQATRIIERKGIEMALDFVKALDTPARRAQLQARPLFDGRIFTQDSRIVLVLAGYTLDDATGNYLNLLKAKARRNNVQMIHIGEIIGHERGERFKQKIYSLWDTYAHADFITYPSLWEGWGNQFLEALCARLPIVLFEYPVYRSDIKDKGFQVISLGSEIMGHDQLGLAEIAPEIIEAAADQAVALLTDAEKRADMVDHNHRIGRQHYSIQALREYLVPLINDL